jgi:hypothetical protein
MTYWIVRNVVTEIFSDDMDDAGNSNNVTYKTIENQAEYVASLENNSNEGDYATNSEVIEYCNVQLYTSY